MAKWLFPIRALLVVLVCLAPLMSTAGVGTAWADCSLTSVGLTPLNDLGRGTYQFPDGAVVAGGLYPDGSDTPPAQHATDGLALAQQVQPLNAAGNPDPNGKIVMVSVGMSNVQDEWTDNTGSFVPRAMADPAKNPKLVVINGGQAGQTDVYWSNYLQDPAHTWATLNISITAAGVFTQQVQVAWLKESTNLRDILPITPTTSITETQTLQNRLGDIARGIKYYYPNIKLAYVSSRSRAYTLGGNNNEDLNPEPFAYQTGFAVKWMIEGQINRVASLNYDPARGPAVAPYLAWGPYLWTDGTTPRSDGFTWLCNAVPGLSDVSPLDFTHPTGENGTPKVASQLLAFFKTDPTARPWFLKPPTVQAPACQVTADLPMARPSQAIHFTGAVTHTVGTITEYAWTYSDGDFFYLQNPADPAVSNVTKSYPAPGTYTATLTVSDSLGNTATCAAPVTSLIQVYLPMVALGSASGLSTLQSLVQNSAYDAGIERLLSPLTPDGW